ncbi:MAG: HAMP domain-containing histidine kinase [Coriobacteriia bacterium]|nr:HAMP domain-containing histidine kinase [Coriobacteriia bacterium]
MTNPVTHKNETDESLVKIVVGDKQLTMKEVMDNMASILKIDSDMLKVILLMAFYTLILVVINGATLGERAYLSHVVSREGALLFFTVFSMPALYFLLKWSKVIHFFRKPLNMLVSVFTATALAAGVVLFWASIQIAVHWGGIQLIILLPALFLILAVAYVNSFIFSLSAKYEQRYEEANQDKIRAERFKSELITNVSHDIQTPLTSIINYSGLLKSLSRDDKDFDKKFEDYTEVLDRKSARLKTLTSDLIEASKAATGNTAVYMQSANLTEVIWQVAGEFDEQFSEKNLSFVLIPSDVQFVASVDPRHLWRILENLFSNMAKYSLEGTRVFAELEQVQEGVVRLSLKNISAEPLTQTGDELTEQFMRGDKSRYTEGSGLGLYIAKSLTELMDGKLAVQVSGDQFEVNLWLNT